MSFAYKSSIESHYTRLPAAGPPTPGEGAAWLVFTRPFTALLSSSWRCRRCVCVTMALQKNLTLLVAVALAVALLSREFGAPRDAVRRRARGWLKELAEALFRD